MMAWLDRHANAVGALSSLLTAVIALAALVAVKIQIDAADQIQKEQSAKEIFREYLNLSIQKPNLAAPDYCALRTSTELPAYQAFVEYLLYAGEQLIEMDADWSAAIHAELAAHTTYLCSPDHASDHYTPEVQRLLTTFKVDACQALPTCAGPES